METDVQHAGPIARRSEAHELFVRVYPAVVGLVRRVLDRPGVDVRSLADAEQVAVEVMAWARRRRLADSDAAVTRIAARALDRCLERIEGSPRRVPLPTGLVVEDLADDDVLDDGARIEWTTSGFRLGELHDAVRVGDPAVADGEVARVELVERDAGDHGVQRVAPRGEHREGGLDAGLVAAVLELAAVAGGDHDRKA